MTVTEACQVRDAADRLAYWFNSFSKRVSHIRDKGIRRGQVSHANACVVRATGKRESHASRSNYTRLLMQLEDAAAEASEVALHSSSTLSEPFIAFEVARTLPPGDGLFLGNSMPIRDMDAFGGCTSHSSKSSSVMVDIESGLGARVSANRGASGIDGVISSAAGFAFGFKRPVTLLIGDVSFLHDINGLNLLRSSEMAPPLTVVLVNNAGGGIFDFLPIASELPKETFTQLWSTPQNVDLAGICRAHGLPHQKVTQPEQLEAALRAARGLNKHSVVEVITCRETNVAQHREIQAEIMAAVKQALQQQEEYKVKSTHYGKYDLPLRRSLTAGPGEHSRRGLILEVTLETGQGRQHTGRGEVAPLPGLHTESLEEAEVQLRAICCLMQAQRMQASQIIDSIDGLDHWLHDIVGADSWVVLPSVRCGLEAAILTAIAHARGSSLSNLLIHSQAGLIAAEALPSGTISEKPITNLTPCNELRSVHLNALANDLGETEQACQRIVETLKGSGCRAVKVKVARSRHPEDDARLLVRLREALGPDITLRADANQGWTLEDALKFAQGAHAADLEYVEEPLKDSKMMGRLAQQSTLPVALDESLDQIFREKVGLQERIDLLKILLSHGNVAALILKPSVLGGLLLCTALARVAQKFSAKAVISSAFESKVGLSTYSQLAAAVDHSQPVEPPTFHGLATSDWFEGNVTCHPLVQNYCIDLEAAQKMLAYPLDTLQVQCLTLPVRQNIDVHTEDGDYEFSVLSFPASRQSHASNMQPFVFLHGFLGSADDWETIALGLSAHRSCIAIDLPGHGQSQCKTCESPESAYSIDGMAKALQSLFKHLGLSDGLKIVAYSMGARIALRLVQLQEMHISGLVLISASPGVENEGARSERRSSDDMLAEKMRKEGLPSFLHSWYSAPMWGDLFQNPWFAKIVSQRAKGDANALANVISAASPGRTETFGDALAAPSTRISIIVGQEDKKYIELWQHMAGTLGSGSGLASLTIVPACGHAVHLEAPLQILHIIQKCFIRQ